MRSLPRATIPLIAMLSTGFAVPALSADPPADNPDPDALQRRLEQTEQRLRELAQRVAAEQQQLDADRRALEAYRRGAAVGNCSQLRYRNSDIERDTAASPPAVNDRSIQIRR